MSDDPVRSGLAEIAAMARELLEWEQVLGGAGVAEAGVAEAGVAEAGVARPAPSSGSSEAKRPPMDAAAPRPEAVPGGLSGGGSRRALEALAEEAAGCERCRLHEGRTRSVFSRGSVEAELVFVGEAPGYHEDQQGLPFVGRAGELLDRMVAAMGFGRDDVYVCNVVKCRPPDNRTPTPDEALACEPYLARQVEVVSPRVIVALGRCAAERLGCLEAGPRGWRGRWSVWKGIDLMPTYHPAFLLRTPKMKRVVWEDLQQVMQRMGRAP